VSDTWRKFSQAVEIGTSIVRPIVFLCLLWGNDMAELVGVLKSSRYLGIEIDDALEMAEQIDV